MKRNNDTVRAGRRTKTKGGKSRYAAKLVSGRMMYGPGCCGHRFSPTPASMAQRRRENHVYVYRGLTDDEQPAHPPRETEEEIITRLQRKYGKGES